MKSEKVTYCLTLTKWHSRKGKTIVEAVEISVDARSSGERGINRQKHGIFRAVKLFCMLLQLWIHVTTHHSEPIEYTISRVNPSLHYGLWGILMCQCRLTNCNKCTTLVWDCREWGKVVLVCGVGTYENSVLFTQFCCEPKTIR